VTREDAAVYIENFLAGLGRPWDWDDFTSIEPSDRELNEIRRVCADLHELYPPTQAGEYCNADGLAVLKRIVRYLRGQSTTW
jgi:hypothetical protein